MKVAVIDAGRKDFTLLLYLLILNCGIAQSLDWTGLVLYSERRLSIRYLSSGGWAVMVMVMVIVSSHAFH